MEIFGSVEDFGLGPSRYVGLILWSARCQMSTLVRFPAEICISLRGRSIIALITPKIYCRWCQCHRQGSRGFCREATKPADCRDSDTEQWKKGMLDP